MQDGDDAVDAEHLDGGGRRELHAALLLRLEARLLERREQQRRVPLVFRARAYHQQQRHLQQLELREQRVPAAHTEREPENSIENSM